ncbi:MAG: hypothetical protein JWQ72_3406 [Polaromonas sp.]|nr:hypothetical protein [Polaromonas sp.]
MELGPLKPLLAGLALPPLSLFLLAFAGLVLAARRRRAGIALATLSLALLWLLSCHGTAVWLAQHALPQFAPTSAAQLKAARVQAIVVLGGGVLPLAPEYGKPQPGAPTAARLRYGQWLAKQSGLPLAFTGGVGWAADRFTGTSEGEVAERMAREDFGVTLRWVESKSRDTEENASMLAPMLQRDGVQRIALVTDARHLPRALRAFERSGLVVTPAPTSFILPEQNELIEWFPSAYGLLMSQQVLREALALAASRAHLTR